jgi:hypothetical protein
MGGARAAKNAQWYELSVAAMLNAHPVKVGETSLDLTEFYFDPNHRPYSSKLTNAGYSAEIDITATKSNVQYNISCKFSEDPERVLRSTSREFRKTVLEFVPLTQLDVSSSLEMNYILATSFIISKELSQRRKWKSGRFDEVAEDVRTLGRATYKDRFNASNFNTDSIRSLLSNLHLVTFSVGDLEESHENNPEFKRAFDMLYRRLLNIPRQGLLLQDAIKSDLTILCEISDHRKCYDTVIEDRTCHIGQLAAIRRKLTDILKTKPSALLFELRGSDIGLIPDKVKSSRSISPEGICRILTSILNDRHLLSLRCPYTFYVLPVTFDIIGFQAFELAQRIEATRDELKRVYPSRVGEIQCLGLSPKAIEDVTILAYSSGFGYGFPRTDIVINEE